MSVDRKQMMELAEATEELDVLDHIAGLTVAELCPCPVARTVHKHALILQQKGMGSGQLVRADNETSTWLWNDTEVKLREGGQVACRSKDTAWHSQ